MRLPSVAVIAPWLACIAAIPAVLPDAQAQRYPARPVRFIVPTTPSGPNDVLTRIIAERLSETLGRQVIVDNRPGAGGRIGLDLAARADADGHTLFLGSQAQLAVHPSLYRLPYNVERDFAPIALVARVRYLLLSHPAVPADDLQGLLRLLRAKPGQLNYASVGAGSSSHIVAELFKKTARVDIVHVPYKGAQGGLACLCRIDCRTSAAHVRFAACHVWLHQEPPGQTHRDRRTESFGAAS